MNVENRIKLEKKIVRKMCKDGIAKGWTVSVNDGEEWTIKRSKDMKAIMKAVMTTDEDIIRFRDGTGERVGDVYLVYGNDGWDVISDYSSNPVMEAFQDEMTKFTSQFE